MIESVSRMFAYIVRRWLLLSIEDDDENAILERGVFLFP